MVCITTTAACHSHGEPVNLGRRRLVRGLVVAGLGLLAGCRMVPLQGQQPTRVPRVGFLSASSQSAPPVEAFQQGLRELGYVEGQNILIEYRYAEGDLGRLNELAAELVRLNVDLIVSAAPVPTRAAKAATSTIPIVMAYDFDPLANGFVASLAHPGGNVTGLSALTPGISGKQLELLKEMVPGLSRVAVLGTSTPGVYPQLALDPRAREVEHAAGALSVQVRYLDVRTAEDIEPAFGEARNGSADAALVLNSFTLDVDRARIADLAAQYHLPAIYTRPDYVEVGGLMSYAVSFNDLYRRSATYVDKILKGSKPADLPVEQPTKFDLAVNLKTAQALGITVPPAVLVQATEVLQ